MTFRASFVARVVNVRTDIAVSRCHDAQPVYASCQLVAEDNYDNRVEFRCEGSDIPDVFGKLLKITIEDAS